MRLAACSTAALGYFTDCHPDYLSASLQDVLSLRDQLTAEKQARERAEAKAELYEEALKFIGKGLTQTSSGEIVGFVGGKSIMQLIKETLRERE
jgi:hypothetical protein